MPGERGICSRLMAKPGHLLQTCGDPGPEQQGQPDFIGRRGIGPQKFPSYPGQDHVLIQGRAQIRFVGIGEKLKLTMLSLRFVGAVFVVCR